MENNFNNSIISELLQKTKQDGFLCADDISMLYHDKQFEQYEGLHAVGFVDKQDASRRIMLTLTSEQELWQIEQVKNRISSLFKKTQSEFEVVRKVNIPQIFGAGLCENQVSPYRKTVIFQEFIENAKPLRNRCNAYYDAKQLIRTINLRSEKIEKLFEDARTLYTKGIRLDLIYPGNNILCKDDGTMFFVDLHTKKSKFKQPIYETYYKLIDALIGPGLSVCWNKGQHELFNAACENVAGALQYYGKGDLDRKDFLYATSLTPLYKFLSK